MGKNKVSLANVDTFGDVAAEDDAVLDYFLATDAVQKISSGDAFLVLGRKGTGKTAIARYFTEKESATLSRSLNLRGYPWAVHSSRIDRGASDIEAYVSSWRYLIAVQLASLVLAQNYIYESQEAKSLYNFLKENYGEVTPKLSDILRPKRIKLSKLSFMPAVMGNQLGGVDLERKKGDLNFGVELDALSTAIISDVVSVSALNNMSTVGLHFDELDQGLSSLDDKRKEMLIGLILAARAIKRETESSTLKLNPIIYLRTDIWDELQFSDKNKISETLTYHLAWDGDSLKKLIEVRLESKIGSKLMWEDIEDGELMRGSQSKWNHVLARTFLRPRDVIKFMNSILAQAKKRPGHPTIITNKDIVNSRDEYSSYLKSELDDEIRPHWEQWDKALQACSAIATITFDKEDFEREFKSRIKDEDFTSNEALATLYQFSVIGYQRRSGYGGSSWSFQYADPESGWDNQSNRFKVHLGLKEYAKLREERR